MIQLKTAAEGVFIPIIAQPGAKRNAVLKFHDGAVKIAVNQPPDKGRANEAIIDLLSDTLKTPIRSLELVAGATSRRKMVLVRGGDVEAIRAALERSVVT